MPNVLGVLSEMSKIIKLPRIGEFVKSGMTLAIGGFELSYHQKVWK